MNRALGPRDAIRFHHENKPRTGVVLSVDVESGAIIVVYGTRTAKERPCLFVPHPSPTATMLDLNQPTYFYAENIVYLQRDATFKVVGRSPPGAFCSLQELWILRFTPNAVRDLATRVATEEIATAIAAAKANSSA